MTMRRPVRALVGGTIALALGLGCGPATAAGGGDTGGGDIVGALIGYVTSEHDTLLEVARRFDLGYLEVIAANPGVDPWVPGAGHELVLPAAHILPQTARRGLVVNLDEMRAYFFPDEGGAPVTYPLGVGAEGHATPVGTTRVIDKAVHPTWVPPPSVRAEHPDLPDIVPPGPDNPLGDYALYVGWAGIRLHGTNKPYGVGRPVSHGCIRFYPEDIKALFPRVAIGTAVTVVRQPVKAGRANGALYLEVHPTLEEAIGLEHDHRLTTPATEKRLRQALALLTKIADADERARLDESLVRRTVADRRGYPVRVTRPAP